jgi:phosphoribosylaminoimidazole-succinocarboxamide synthase
MNKEPLLCVDLPEVKLFKRGKVRDIYQIDDNLLMVATDRISAFDVVMPNGIPEKGKILTRLSVFWFEFTRDIIDNHLITSNFNKIISLAPRLKKYQAMLEGRSILVKKTQPLPLECVVRGYLAGSGWEEYRQRGTVCGIQLPPGLQKCEKLPQPIFTPATKAIRGHDENITQEEAKEIVGEEVFKKIKTKSLAIYKKASQYAEKRGIIIADTKFEFGRYKGKIILIDELLTPDSSRFWPKDEYKVGKSQRSFDKQFVRDYLEGLNWRKSPPAPPLPPEVVRKTSEKYLEVFEKLSIS